MPRFDCRQGWGLPSEFREATLVENQFLVKQERGRTVVLLRQLSNPAMALHSSSPIP